MGTPHFTRCPDVAGPVTIAWAEKDRLLLPRQAERARRALPRARHLTLAGCGHVPTWDDPAQVAEAILSS
jgi:pimeloyl-ACP methyl ester carboxylesterase